MNWNFRGLPKDVDELIRLRKFLLKLAGNLLFFFSIAAFLVVLYDFGFSHAGIIDQSIDNFYSVSLIIFFVALTIRHLASLKKPVRRGEKLYAYLLYGLLFLGIISRLFPESVFITKFSVLAFLSKNFFAYLIIFFVFLGELSKRSLSIYNQNLNPALMFVLSFLLLITAGASLLLLPQSTFKGISVTDAFFTSVSAVCVTGLIVVDTATYFTAFGKTVILILIQLGGLGIMTFTSFFGLFFQGSTSFQNQLFLKDFVNETKIGETFRTLVKVVGFTIGIELSGALLIFFTLDGANFATTGDKIQFAVFHAISAFCNAGFSTLTNNLYETGFRFNYSLHLIIAFLIIFGGLGFPIMFNYYKYIKHHLVFRPRQYILNREFFHTPRIINVNSNIVVVTTISLLIFGTILYFILEQNNTLRGHSLYGQIVTAFFGAVTPRTAGFNTVDLTAMAGPTIILFLLLMWIGGSPGSTAGGIKTTTFAVAVLNTLSIAKGKERLEVFKREIADESVKRAFTVITLSLMILAMSIFLLVYFEPRVAFYKIAFECFSAFGTVGVSLNLTGTLGIPSKVVLMCTMFAGRVGALTIIMAFVSKMHSKNYRYPSENIFIN
jgi:potassium uptake TrkH family protein